MVRNYKPVAGVVKPKSYTAEQLQVAVDRVKKGEAIRKVSAKTGIPRRTLTNHVTGQRGGHGSTGGRPPALFPEEELSIAQHVAVLSDYGYAFDQHELQLFVKSFLDDAGRSASQFKNNLPGVEWTLSFIKRHKDILSKRMSQNINRKRAAISSEQVNKFFNNLEVTGVNDVPPENINYDETNFCDDPKAVMMLFRKGVKRAERVMNVSKTTVSVMFAGSASGALLPPYVVYKAEHLMNSWVLGGPLNTRYNRTKSGWFDSHCFSDWFDKVALPYFARLENDQPRILIGDNLASHISANILTKCEHNNIKFILLPPNSTHLLQPLDVGVYGPMKKSWRKVLTEWKKGPGKHYTNMPKQWFPYLLLGLRKELTNIDTLIVNAFAATGIYPLNKDRVLAKITHVNSPHTDMVSPLVIRHLEHLREQCNTKPNAPVRAKRLLVSPGKSVTSQDVQPSTSGVARQLIPSKKRKERSPSPSSSDSSSIFHFEPLDEEEVVSEAESSTTEALLSTA